MWAHVEFNKLLRIHITEEFITIENNHTNFSLIRCTLNKYYKTLIICVKINIWLRSSGYIILLHWISLKDTVYLAVVLSLFLWKFLLTILLFQLCWFWNLFKLSIKDFSKCWLLNQQYCNADSSVLTSNTACMLYLIQEGLLLFSLDNNFHIRDIASLLST